MTLFVLSFLSVICVSFVCSLLEAVLLSVTPVYIEVLAKKKNRSAKLLRAFKHAPNHPLAAILSCNTIANTMGAAIVGVEAANVFGQSWLALSSALLTLSILIFSEVVPKTIGTLYWRMLAPPAAYAIRALMLVLYPCVFLAEGVAGLFSKGSRRARVTLDELEASTEMSTVDGALHVNEAGIIKNILRLRKIHVRDIFTPRSVMLAFQQDQTVGQIIKEFSPIRFSRIPVFGKDLDDVVGYALRYNILQSYYRGQGHVPVGPLANRLHAVPLAATVSSVLDSFIRRGEHIFLVVDEYGGTAGIITMEDAIETLLGVEIVDEFDTVDDLRTFAARSIQRRRDSGGGAQSAAQAPAGEAKG